MTRQESVFPNHDTLQTTCSQSSPLTNRYTSDIHLSHPIPSPLSHRPVTSAAARDHCLRSQAAFLPLLQDSSQPSHGLKRRRCSRITGRRWGVVDCEPSPAGLSRRWSFIVVRHRRSPDSGVISRTSKMPSDGHFLAGRPTLVLMSLSMAETARLEGGGGTEALHFSVAE